MLATTLATALAKASAAAESVEARVGDGAFEGAVKGRRRAWVPGRDAFAEVPVYDRYAMGVGSVVEGPAIRRGTGGDDRRARRLHPHRGRGG